MGWFRSTFGRMFGGSRPVQSVEVRARYDAAQTTTSHSQHWAAADALDADSANSKAVRNLITRRARYEVGSNGHGKGITLTQANYVVGRGPKLRMQTKSAGFNAMVEAAWGRWFKRVKLARKLRTAVKGKVTDGEGILLAVVNENVRDTVKLDVVGLETEHMTTPYLDVLKPGRVDGIEFDEFGNPVYYHILKHHPGGQWSGLEPKPDRIAARFVFHLFREDRAGQHRGVSEMSPTLNLFAQGRRFRESTVTAAENIANWSILLKTQQTPDDGPDLMRPLSTLPNEKGMMVGLPAGYDAYQPKAEQPTATFSEFNRTMVCEEARPLNMPYNIAAADSSGYSFSGGKLDHLTYFVSVDVEQSEIEDLVLDPLFELWFEEATLAYGWSVPKENTPAHGWDWPAKPQIDEVKTSNARQTSLSFGGTSLRRIFAEDGLDFEDELQAMAEDYGVSVEEMRRLLLEANLRQGQSQQSQDDDDGDDTPPTRKPANAGYVARFSLNGHGGN